MVDPSTGSCPRFQPWAAGAASPSSRSQSLDGVWPSCVRDLSLLQWFSFQAKARKSFPIEGPAIWHWYPHWKYIIWGSSLVVWWLRLQLPAQGLLVQPLLLFSRSIVSDSLQSHGLSLFPVLLCLPEFAQTHVHWVGDAIQLSHPLLLSSPPAFNLSQHQDLFQWISSSHQVAKVLELQLQHQSFQCIFGVDFL